MVRIALKKGPICAILVSLNPLVLVERNKKKKAKIAKVNITSFTR